MAAMKAADKVVSEHDLTLNMGKYKKICTVKSNISNKVHYKFVAALHCGSPTAINIKEGKAAGFKG